MTEKAKLTHDDLQQFTGTENWYRHAINRRVTFRDGAKYVADTGCLLAARRNRSHSAIRQARFGRTLEAWRLARVT